MDPAGSQKAQLEHFLALAPNGPRRLSKGSSGTYSGLGRQTPPEGHQEAHLEHFLTLGAKWFQQALSMLIWSISWP